MLDLSQRGRRLAHCGGCVPHVHRGQLSALLPNPNTNLNLPLQPVIYLLSPLCSPSSIHSSGGQFFSRAKAKAKAKSRVRAKAKAKAKSKVKARASRRPILIPNHIPSPIPNPNLNPNLKPSIILI